MSAATATAPVAPKKKGKMPLLIVGALVLAGGGAAGGWWWTQRSAAHAAPAAAEAKPVRGKAEYFALDPAFVVNLADTDAARYLQADVEVMSRDAATLTLLDEQAPAIRNRLLLLFGQQTAAQIGQRSGKERLQGAALAEVRKVVGDEGGAKDKVEAVIFTSLVVQ